MIPTAITASISDFSENELDLRLVMNELVDVCAQWYHLGMQLNVKCGALDRIRVQFFDPRDQLLEMFKVWVDSNTDASWKTLVKALRSQHVGASRLASRLETKYCVEVDRSTNVSSLSSVSGAIITEQTGICKY